MTYVQSFFFKGKHYGDTLRAPKMKWGTPFVPDSFVFICPKCGSVWAQVAVHSDETYHRAQMEPCPEHGRGSINCSWDEEYTASLPTNLLAREIQLLIDERTQLCHNYHSKTQCQHLA